MIRNKLTVLLSCLIISSCTFLFGKSLPPLKKLSEVEKNKIISDNDYSFKIFGKGFIRVDSEVNRLRIIMLCDNSKNRFRLEVIPVNSSLPLGIITGKNQLYKFYSPTNKKLISNVNSSKLINELIGIEISDKDICSIFSKKLSLDTLTNLQKVFATESTYINTKSKIEYELNPESLALEKITLGKYTNSYKVFSLSNSNNNVSIDSDKINIKGKFNFILKQATKFNDSIFNL